MPQRIVSDPKGGLPGNWQVKNGTYQGVYRITAIVYGPNEAVEAGDRTTLPELRAKYWDAARRSLVIPFNGGSYEFGSDLLSQADDTTVIQIRYEFWDSNPAPQRECNCGRLSFRHAVAYHSNNRTR